MSSSIYECYEEDKFKADHPNIFNHIELNIPNGYEYAQCHSYDGDYFCICYNNYDTDYSMDIVFCYSDSTLNEIKFNID